MASAEELREENERLKAVLRERNDARYNELKTLVEEIHEAITGGRDPKAGLSFRVITLEQKDEARTHSNKLMWASWIALIPLIGERLWAWAIKHFN